MDKDVLNIVSSGWEQSRNVSEGSLSTSNEQLALIGFAHRLGSTVMNDEADIADETDVRKEARLLMSLSCSSPVSYAEDSGRITPQSDVSSCHSSNSRRDSFSFTCPSLSLENRGKEPNADDEGRKIGQHSTPATLLGRTLKVDDKDALRLSSEAMARNIMQSYQRALSWRIQSWANMLGGAIAEKERSMKNQNASENQLMELLNSGEATLLKKLGEIADTMRVVDSSTTFKVSPQRVLDSSADKEADTKTGVPGNVEADMVSLEEHEYKYQVAHYLTLECSMCILTPGSGYVQIELNIPGMMQGTFLSTDNDGEQLIDVTMTLNTDMLASMIEKSCRVVVRSSVEALLESDRQEALKAEDAQTVETSPVTAEASPVPTFTPKRNFSEERVSGLVVVTPRDSSSPSSFEDSDNENKDKPVLLCIPDNFTEVQPKTSLRMLTPQPSRARDMDNVTDFVSRLPPKKKMRLPTVVTPHKQSQPNVEAEGKGPNLPVLVEVACAAMRAK